MKPTLIFPTILIALDICAAFVYLVHGDVRHFIYWMTAATLIVPFRNKLAGNSKTPDI